MSLIGLMLALLAILGGNMIEGGHPSALLDLPAFLIVIGGTIGAALTQFPFSVVGKTFKRFKWLLSPPKLDKHNCWRPWPATPDAAACWLWRA
jgi:chemotaxis protein MotA